MSIYKKDWSSHGRDDPDRTKVVANLNLGERMLALEARLLEVLAGKATPSDNKQRVDMIEVCRLQRRHAAASRLYADAFAADPRLADDINAAHRYRAACFAILAAAGRGTDIDGLTGDDRNRLRRQALDWLRAELATCSKCLETGSAADRKAARARLQHLQTNANLRHVREPDALAKLPAGEQQAWRQWWTAVAEAVKRIE